MTKNQTENYALPLWESADRVERADFNDLSQKLDTALHTLSAASCRIAVGSYVGDNTTPRTIALGFTPRAVYLAVSDGTTQTRVNAAGLGGTYYGGLALRDVPITRNDSRTDGGDIKLLEIVEGGFRVINGSATYNQTYSYSYPLNSSSYTYVYFAIG